MGSVTHCLGSQLALCLQLFVYMKALIAFKSVSVCHLKTDKSVVTSVVITLMANPECMTFVPFSKELDLMFIKKDATKCLTVHPFVFRGQVSGFGPLLWGSLTQALVWSRYNPGL